MGGRTLRWETLFADLAAQVDVLERGERDGEVDDRTRHELGAVHLIDRFRASFGDRVRVECAGALQIEGVLAHVGPDWLLLEERGGRDAVVSTAALVSVRGLTKHARTPGEVDRVESKLGLRSALRGIARDRSEVRTHLGSGACLTATIDRVGHDYIDVAISRGGELRRPQDVLATETIPLTALSAVRRLA